MANVPSLEDIQHLTKVLKGFQRGLHQAWPVLNLTALRSKDDEDMVYCYLHMIYHSHLYLFENDSLEPDAEPWITEEQSFQTSVVNKVLFKLRLKMIPMGINSTQEGLFSVTQGETFRSAPLDSNAIGRLIIPIPSEQTGGEFYIVSREGHITHIAPLSGRRLWIAVFGNNTIETQPVLSGTLLFTSYTLYMRQQQEDAITSLPDFARCPELHVGPIETSVQERFIESLAPEMDTDTALILKTQTYKNEKKYTLDMLTGTDKLLVNKLEKLGFSFQIHPVLLSSEFRNLSAVPCFFAETDGHRFELPEPEVKHYMLDFNTEEVVIPKTRFPSSFPIIHSVVPVLVMKPPTWWTYVRLLWIGWMKNSPLDCPLASVPTEILQQIISQFMQEYKQIHQTREEVKSRKRKRQEEEKERDKYLQAMYDSSEEDFESSDEDEDGAPNECNQS